MTDTGDMDATTTRSCRACQARFAPFLVTDTLCGACVRAGRDRVLVLRHLLDARFVSVDATAAAAGVPAAVVAAMVDDGTIDPRSGGTEATSCSCPTGVKGRCPACRRRLADGLRALDAARPTAPEAGARRLGGLRARRPS